MANLVAIRGWTQPGDEIIADVTVHSYNYESPDRRRSPGAASAY